MIPIVTVEKKTMGTNGAMPVIFLNNNYFTDFIQPQNGYYEIADSADHSHEYCCAPPVYLKNAGSGVILMPAWQEMLTEFEYGAHITSSMHLNYPDHLKQQIYFFSPEKYNELCNLLPNCPSQDQLPLLTKEDVADIVRWESPCKDERFGISETIDFNFNLTPKLTKELYVTTTAQEGKQVLSLLESLLKEYSTSADPVTLVPAPESVSIVLDTQEFLDWKPLAKTKEGYTLRIEPGLQVVA